MNTTYIILSVFLIISVIGLIIIGSLYYFTARISKSFKEQENDYKTLSKESLESIIEPFKNRIKEFEDEIKKIEKVEKMYKDKLITDEERKKMRSKILGID